jgi:transaldolase
MRLFLDTANLDEIREASSWGVISGITTNPVLIRKEGTTDVKKRIRDILSILDVEVLTEVLADSTREMIRQARELSSLSPRITIKVPATMEGISAISAISKEGIRTCMTIVFTVSQALLAALAGATYVAPFVGRSREICQDGHELVSDIVAAFQKQEIGTQVIAASIVTPKDVVDAVKAGAKVVTAPLATIKKMVAHPNSEATLIEFMQGWKGNEV